MSEITDLYDEIDELVRDEDGDDYWDNYQTGPFCRHWSDPTDCDVKCANCGHRCTDHDFEDGECMICDCKEWLEPEEE